MEGRKRTRRAGGSRFPQSIPSKMRKSCDACALAKRKCDGRARCSLCLKRGSPCVYSERQKSGPKGAKADEPRAVCAPLALASTNPAPSPKPAKRARGPQLAPTICVREPQDSQQDERERFPATTGWMATTLQQSDAKVVTPTLAPRSAPTIPSPSRRVNSKKSAVKGPRSRHRKKQQHQRHQQKPAEEPLQPQQHGLSLNATAAKLPAPVSPTRVRSGGNTPPPAVTSPGSGTLALLPTLPQAEVKRFAPLLGKIGHDMPPVRSARQQQQQQQPQLQVQSVSMTNVEVVPSARCDSSVDGSLSGWEEVPLAHMSGLEDEALWSCDDLSDEEGRHHTLDNSFRAGVLSFSTTTSDRGSIAHGVLDAARPAMNSGRQHHQQQKFHARLGYQHQRRPWSHGRSSSPNVVSRLQAVGAGFESLALGAGGSDGAAAFVVGGGAHRGCFTPEGFDSNGDGERSQGGINSPIASWTNEMVEDGASALLAVLSGTDTGVDFPTFVGGGLGTDGNGRGCGKVTRPPPGVAQVHYPPPRYGASAYGIVATGNDSSILSPPSSISRKTFEPRRWQPGAVAAPKVVPRFEAGHHIASL